MKRAGQVSPDGWGRARLLLLLVAVCAAAAVLLAGLGYAVWAAASTTPGSATAAGHDASAGTAKVGTGRDRIAAAPMLAVSPEDAQPAPPAPTPAPDIEIPDPSATGLAGVPAGFPHTPEGALGQLAAVEVAVLQQMSIARAVQVHQSWALPGGIPAGDWELTTDVRTFLGTARMGAQKDPVAVITATPAAAQVKGVDGPDWVLACVLLDVRATITMEARVGYGHCERMQWHAGRWMIAAGPTPAPAPSTWPDTPIALQAGWRTWTRVPERAR